MNAARAQRRRTNRARNQIAQMRRQAENLRGLDWPVRWPRVIACQMDRAADTLEAEIQPIMETTHVRTA